LSYAGTRRHFGFWISDLGLATMPIMPFCLVPFNPKSAIPYYISPAAVFKRLSEEINPPLRRCRSPLSFAPHSALHTCLPAGRLRTASHLSHGLVSGRLNHCAITPYSRPRFWLSRSNLNLSGRPSPSTFFKSDWNASSASAIFTHRA